MKVKEIMSSPVVTLTADTSLADAARVMLDGGFGCLPVTGADGKLVGIITESSFAAKSVGVPFSTFRAPQVLGKWLNPDGIEKIYESARETPVASVMKTPVITLGEDDQVSTAVRLMLTHDINRIPIVRDGIPIGVVARHDLLRLIASSSL
jgi:CBS domain-containing protein